MRPILGAKPIVPATIHDALDATRPQVPLKPVGKVYEVLVVRMEHELDIALPHVVVPQ